MKIIKATTIKGENIGDPSNRGDSLEIVGADASGTVIEDCLIYGGIRIYGLGKNGNVLSEYSSRPDFTELAQAEAPSGVVIRNCTIIANGGIPVYFGPGTTNSVLAHTDIFGETNSSTVYLDCESEGNVIRNSTFDCDSGREVLSIDGSANNLIENNRFRKSDKGGVFLYRNCGEGGSARHQKPQYNVIIGNTFEYENRWFALPTIWTSYRDPIRCILCRFFMNDDHMPYGSGPDNKSYARYNKFIGNQFKNPPLIHKKILDWDKDNTIER